MNILFDINHPGQVHLFRNTIKELQSRNHNVVVTIKEIPSAIELLKKYNIGFIYLGSKSDTLIGKALNQVRYNFRLWKILKKFNIDIAIGSSITVDHASRFCNAKALHFSDDDPDVVPFVVKYAHPFADNILCPDCLSFPRHQHKVVPYAGYHELAYLHPAFFSPDPEVLKLANLAPDEPFFIMRFNAFKAHHDVGVQGINLEQKKQLIETLESHGRILITSEGKIESELEKYQLVISPEKIHSLIYYAQIFLGDSQTMTTEAAILGTPALKCNTFAGRLSVHNELERKYGLCYSFLPEHFDQFYKKLSMLLINTSRKTLWQEKREKFLESRINVTAFMLWFIENYPDSARIMRENPDYQYNFR